MVRGMMRTPMRIEAIASARYQPVVVMTAAAQNSDRAECVVDDLGECRAHVEVSAAAAGQDEHTDEVADQADDAEDDDHRGLRPPLGGSKSV